MQLDRLPAQPSSSSPSPAQPPARRGLVAAAIVGAVALAGAVTRIAAAPPVAATPVAATPASSLSRVGVVNVQVVRDKIQEYKAFVAHFKDEQTSAELMARGHQADLKLLNDKLGQLKPDSDQAEDQLTAAQEKLADFNKDEQQSKAKLQREYNKQTKTLFVEIQQVVADLSKRKGLDLVIVQPEVQLPVNVQNVDPQQLNAYFNQKTVLYASPSIDLTDEVVSQLDANFKAHGGVVPTPTPAPAPAK